MVVDYTVNDWSVCTADRCLHSLCDECAHKFTCDCGEGVLCSDHATTCDCCETITCTECDVDECGLCDRHCLVHHMVTCGMGDHYACSSHKRLEICTLCGFEYCEQELKKCSHCKEVVCHGWQCSLWCSICEGPVCNVENRTEDDCGHALECNGEVSAYDI